MTVAGRRVHRVCIRGYRWGRLVIVVVVVSARSEAAPGAVAARGFWGGARNAGIQLARVEYYVETRDWGLYVTAVAVSSSSGGVVAEVGSFSKVSPTIVRGDTVITGRARCLDPQPRVRTRQALGPPTPPANHAAQAHSPAHPRLGKGNTSPEPLQSQHTSTLNAKRSYRLTSTTSTCSRQPVRP